MGQTFARKSHIGNDALAVADRVFEEVEDPGLERNQRPDARVRRIQ
jgi:hypothetical protein